MRHSLGTPPVYTKGRASLVAFDFPHFPPKAVTSIPPSSCRQLAQRRHLPKPLCQNVWNTLQNANNHGN